MNPRYKYPQTPHVPFSPGTTRDDKVLSNLDHFINKEVIVSEKMDGENTTCYSDYYQHARSIDSTHHPARDWVKAFHSKITHNIPSGWRICGENLYAKHSIEYNELENYFYAFSIWDEDNYCLNWDSTIHHCNSIGVHIVPELWRGKFNEKTIIELANNLDLERQEGFVMRLSSGFEYRDFGTSVAKYVRKNHVQTDDH